MGRRARPARRARPPAAREAPGPRRARARAVRAQGRARRRRSAAGPRRRQGQGRPRGQAGLPARRGVHDRRQRGGRQRSSAGATPRRCGASTPRPSPDRVAQLWPSCSAPTASRSTSSRRVTPLGMKHVLDQIARPAGRPGAVVPGPAHADPGGVGHRADRPLRPGVGRLPALHLADPALPRSAGPPPAQVPPPPRGPRLGRRLHQAAAAGRRAVRARPRVERARAPRDGGRARGGRDVPRVPDARPGRPAVRRRGVRGHQLRRVRRDRGALRRGPDQARLARRRQFSYDEVHMRLSGQRTGTHDQPRRQGHGRDQQRVGGPPPHRLHADHRPDPRQEAAPRPAEHVSRRPRAAGSGSPAASGPAARSSAPPPPTSSRAPGRAAPPAPVSAPAPAAASSGSACRIAVRATTPTATASSAASAASEISLRKNGSQAARTRRLRGTTTSRSCAITVSAALIASSLPNRSYTSGRSSTTFAVRSRPAQRPRRARDQS